MINAVTGALPLTVQPKQIIQFPVTKVMSNRSVKNCCNRCGWLIHEEGSGQFLLVNEHDCGAVFEIQFNANVANPEADATASAGGATANAAASPTDPIVLSMVLNGEEISGTEMDYTPSAGGVYGNVSASTLVRVPIGSSVTIAVENEGAGNILVNQGNIIVKKIA